MFNFLGQSPVWQLITISDWISKYVILLGLFFLSIGCIAIIIYKIMTLRFQKQQTKKLLTLVRTTKSLSEVARLAKEYNTSIGGNFLANALAKLKYLLEKSGNASQSSKILTSQEHEKLEFILQQEMSTLITEEESYLSVLGTSAAVSPLIGLFGTIWGLIHSFISISQQRATDISVVAPGIAAALLTTLAGLVVAIPAMVAFHYLTNELRIIEMQLQDLNDLFIMIVKDSIPTQRGDYAQASTSATPHHQNA